MLPKPIHQMNYYKHMHAKGIFPSPQIPLYMPEHYERAEKAKASMHKLGRYASVQCAEDIGVSKPIMYMILNGGIRCPGNLLSIEKWLEIVKKEYTGPGSKDVAVHAYAREYIGKYLVSDSTAFVYLDATIDAIYVRLLRAAMHFPKYRIRATIETRYPIDSYIDGMSIVGYRLVR